ncbi:MAG: Mobile element protein [Candidatus Bipolaricaulis sibiricus]|uniref:Mobile element protein n=1 Tax=Bipolaricaulis sibiricus TaxID=2501609 RepID=A0A410FV31_BIPS1|nr:MAG: Mobile element protein [Candidatus Bipolaricaulis sibiricus]QAA76832.1 MAG: Mobile element protein [Candidatus Bipolaricaulis sibiricus]
MGPHLRVGVDVGAKSHHVGIADREGRILENFVIPHSQEGFARFFSRVEKHSSKLGVPVVVAMEGLNGWSRPLDQMILARGYRLYNVNNLKLARFREIFPGGAKTDALDVRKILELWHLQDHLPVAKDVLQEVPEAPPENQKLKRLTRRRRQLVNEKVRVVNRMQSDLLAVCPELLAITGDATNLWFLRFVASRDDLRELRQTPRNEVLAIRGIGKKYAGVIAQWQKKARFSAEAEYVGPMIVADARRLLEVLREIATLEEAIEGLVASSPLAQRIDSIPGFGAISSGELAGEIGTMDRFHSERSLALYLGMCPLDHQSGEHKGSKRPRQVNRRAKATMMTAVARHMAKVPQSRAYYEKKRAEGKKHNQAVRALGRHLVRVMWAMLTQGRDYELREDSCPG